MRFTIVVFSFCSMLFANAFAAELCSRIGMTSIEEGKCLSAQNIVSESQLSKKYKSLLAAADRRQKKRLIASERAWINYRQTFCDYQEDMFFRGGNGSGRAISRCFLNITQRHILELKQVP